MENKEMVNHPEHYKFGEDNNYEVIKIIEVLDMDFHIGNAFKYISRSGRKDKDKEIEDLEKAIWYLNRKIRYLQQK
jgi:hypothetical protein